MVGEGVEEVVGMGVDVGARMELEDTGPVVVILHFQSSSAATWLSSVQ